MRLAVQQHLAATRDSLESERGPGFFGRWLKWKTPTYDNVVAETVQKELRELLNQSEVRRRQNMQFYF